MNYVVEKMVKRGTDIISFEVVLRTDYLSEAKECMNNERKKLVREGFISAWADETYVKMSRKTESCIFTARITIETEEK